jgi:signal transduction histidine kinase
MINSLAARFGIIVLVVKAILLPPLYVQLDHIVTTSYKEMYVTEIRTYARVVADELETGSVLDSPDHTRALLENVLLSGEGLFAELIEGGNVIYVRVAPPGYAGHFLKEDFEFGEGDDNIYYLSTPVIRGDRELSLRIGFDERPLKAQIQRTRGLIQWSLGIYFLVAIVLAMLLGHLLARPLKALQGKSRRVALGETGLTLSTDSQIRELRNLAEDLERMRSELVEVNNRLHKEMLSREEEAEHRQKLEQKLQIRRRLETVGTLAGGVAHEINNVLVPIQLYTEMAIEDLDESSTTRADLLRVLENARRAKRIVSDVLVFTRRPDDAGLQPVQLAEIVREVLALYRRTAPGNLRIEEQLDLSSSRVRGDGGMLHQVVTNLCSNALQAIGDEGGLLRVSLVPATASEVAAVGLPPEDYVVLRVRDTGHGMDEATRQKVFEPFFTTRPAGQGTGLGLSVVHGMVESLGGAITVDSTPAVGSTFSVFLQRAKWPETAAE